MNLNTPPPPGSLVDIGPNRISRDVYTFFRCLTCATLYPVIHGHIKCNGYIIEQCPHCAKNPSETERMARGAGPKGRLT